MSSLRDAVVVLALMVLVLSVRVAPLDDASELTPEVHAAALAPETEPPSEPRAAALDRSAEPRLETQTLILEETAVSTFDSGVVEPAPRELRIVVLGSELSVQGEVVVEIDGAEAVRSMMFIAPKLLDLSTDALSNTLDIDHRRLVIDADRS
jgi:hypothetical protein